jgi:coenzyme F420 biosynthesis associated uncharacterized protein
MSSNVTLKPKPNLRRLGVLLLVGGVAGYGAHYLATRASRGSAGRETARTAVDAPPRPIDWERARKVALHISGWEGAGIAMLAQRRAQYARLVKGSEPAVARYLGVALPQPVGRVYVVNRREWLEANFNSLAHVLAPLEALIERLGARQGAPSGFNGQLMGVQMGVLLGYLARRVLGQYDLSLLSPDPEARGSLYFVEPNIARVQRQLGVSDEDFRLWIALHEVTHVFQFEAYPWVRPYFEGLLRELLAQLADGVAAPGVALPQLLARLVRGGLAQGHWLERMLSPQERRIFDQLQALMSLVEGYSNHVMNAIGKELLPSFDTIERRVKERQRTRPLLEEFFNRVTGMELKRAQYQHGEAFVNAVVAARGVAFANRVWERAEHLPTMAEIRQPQRWIARLGG